MKCFSFAPEPAKHECDRVVCIRANPSNTRWIPINSCKWQAFCILGHTATHRGVSLCLFALTVLTTCEQQYHKAVMVLASYLFPSIMWQSESLPPRLCFSAGHRVFPKHEFQEETLQTKWTQYKHGLQQMLLNSSCSVCLSSWIHFVGLKQK